MSKTRLELIEQSLTNLGILAEGQSTSAQDVSKMDGIVDPALAELMDLQIYYVADAGTPSPPTGGAIEDSAFLSLAAYIANAACSAFNLPADAKMQALAQVAEHKLITLIAPTSTRRTLRVDPALVSHHRYRGGWW